MSESTNAPVENRHHAGFVCLIGRPNVGKSSLINAMVGGKIAITSSKPQTTRHAIRGIITRPEGQIVIVDTPGLHRPRTLLGERLNALVQDTYYGVDIVGLCIPADEKIGPGDKWIEHQVSGLPERIKVVGIVTKIDKVSPEQVAAQLLAVAELLPQSEIFSVSIKSPESVAYVAQYFMENLPLGPALYPDGEITDEPDEILMAECIREAALEEMEDELPHSIMVTIEETFEKESAKGKTLVIYANLFLERDSQKAIVIGKRGQRLKEIGSRARKHIEHIFDTKVFLDIRVKVAKDWQRDPNQLGKLGF